MNAGFIQVFLSFHMQSFKLENDPYASQNDGVYAFGQFK